MITNFTGQAKTVEDSVLDNWGPISIVGDNQDAEL